jgi:hypothetical protein
MGDFNARAYRRRKGQATYRIIRYADDFVVMVAGTRTHAEGLRQEVAAALTPMGLRLSAEKTRIAHIDEGFDFLGFHIQRHKKRGATKRYVYTYPAKNEPTARGPTRPDQPDPSGLDQLLQARRVQGDLRLPWRLHLASGAHLAPSQAQAGELEVAAGPLPPRVAADRRQGGIAQPGSGDGQPLPLPGTAHPLAVVGSRNGTMNPSAWAWGEPDARLTGTSGSEEQAGKTTVSQERHRVPA